MQYEHNVTKTIKNIYWYLDSSQIAPGTIKVKEMVATFNVGYLWTLPHDHMCHLRLSKESTSTQFILSDFEVNPRMIGLKNIFTLIINKKMSCSR